VKNTKVLNNGHARLFNNPYLEVFTLSSPVLSWVTYSTIIASLLIYSMTALNYDLLSAFVLFSGGIKCWSLFEYLMHRFVFHWISSNPKIEKLTYLIHGNHHHFPKDRKRLFMPLAPGLVVSLSLLGMMYLMAGNYALMFFPGFILGHLIQSTIHYAIHSGPAPYKWLRPLWRSHQLHHYSNEEKGFGLTSTFWDHVFGTNFDLKKHKEDKEKVQALMFED
jgi:sterol desaturase/sphingolipid hydroxylase (fatty acid hydroxylase superfamily)